MLNNSVGSARGMKSHMVPVMKDARRLHMIDRSEFRSDQGKRESERASHVPRARRLLARYVHIRIYAQYTHEHIHMPRLCILRIRYVTRAREQASGPSILMPPAYLDEIPRLRYTRPPKSEVWNPSEMRRRRQSTVLQVAPGRAIR